MKATVFQSPNRQAMEEKLNGFLRQTPAPVVRFLGQSEYVPEKMTGLRSVTSNEPHITVTMLWE